MEPFTPVRTRSVSSDVLEQILQRIRSGQLKEGDTLPGERALATQMDVSRPTVSAAIERLVDADILTRRAGRGGAPTVVSIWIPPGLNERGFEEPHADEIFRLLEARRAVEPRMAQLASLRATGHDYARMAESIDLLRHAKTDINRASQAESLFHRIMWRAAGNHPLERMLINLFDELAVVHDMMLRTPEDYAAGVELHESTLAAIRKGDLDLIDREMSRHLGHFEAIVEDVLQQSPHRQLPTFLAPVSTGSG
jgi:DNA-binding FadR family transcriptional regulator